MGVLVREKIKGSNDWWIFINHRGRRRSKHIGDRKTARVIAEQVRAKLILDPDAMQEDDKKDMPLFRDYALIWLESYIGTMRKKSTYVRYKGLLSKYVFPVIGNKHVDDIKRSDVRDLLLRVSQTGKSKKSVQLIRDVISGPMGYAVDEELIKSNPVTGLTKKLNLRKNGKSKADPLRSDEEVKLFLNTCKAEVPEFYPFFMCAFRTGMRLGELLALQWGDIDWNDRYILVNRSYRRKIVSTTKSGEARRIDMSDQLLEALRMHERAQKRAWEYDIDGLVFHRKGSHMDEKFIRRIYERVLSKAGIRKRRFHDIRHTYGSMLLSKGVSVLYVKEQMGHSSIQITVDTYGHWIPNSNRAAVNSLDEPHLFTPYPPHPAKNKNQQVIEFAGVSS